MAQPRFTHYYSIGFSVHTDSPADEVNADEIIEAIKYRASELTTDQAVVEAVGDPDETVEHLS